MKTVKSLPYVLLIGLLFALAGSVGLGLAQGPEPPEEEAQPQGEVSIAGTVGSKFSYQGLLEESGQPVTGSRDMTFCLYSDNTCSTQVGSDIVKSGVQVTDGLFSVELGVGHHDFDGQRLWLQVEVGGTQIGCQEILPVPYALSLRPGALISSTRDGMLYVRSTGTGDSDVLVAHAMEGSGEGVSAYAMDGSGVYGVSTNSYGVHGYSYNDTAIYAGGTGHVKQVRSGNGLVKAAAYVPCGSGYLFCTPSRSFNNVNTIGTTCSTGLLAGTCTIDFGFDISDRFWSATAVEFDVSRYGVTCELGSGGDSLNCARWNAATGAGDDGTIMVLVY
jgi:hypothetical protein